MMREVCECLQRIIATRQKPQIEPVVDGYTGFLILNRNDMPYLAQHCEKYFCRAAAKYNSVNIVMTLDVYTHLGIDDAKKEIERISKLS